MNIQTLIGPFHNVDVAQEELQNKNKIPSKYILFNNKTEQTFEIKIVHM